jgi:hypothetical protein
VAGGDDDIRDSRRAPDRRQAVGETGAQTARDGHSFADGFGAEGATPCHLDRLDRAVVDGHVSAAQLEHSG